MSEAEPPEKSTAPDGEPLIGTRSAESSATESTEPEDEKMSPAAIERESGGKTRKSSVKTDKKPRLASLGKPDLQCKRCGSFNVKRSRRHGVGEWLENLFGYRYYRCHDCLTRFSFRQEK